MLIRSEARHIPLADESVQCCITSPPYWGLRSYHGGDNMIGLEPTFEEHLANLVAVFREVWRVLRKDGTVWLNYGDAYAAQKPGITSGDPFKTSGLAGTRTARVARAQKQDTIRGSGLKPKDLMLMPARVALALQAPHLKCRGCGHVAHESRWGRWPNGRRICPGCEKSKGADVETPGWWVRSEIVWHKPNPMPESCTDRPTSAHEKVFLLTKSARYFYDAEAVRVPSTGGAHARRSDGKRVVNSDPIQGDRAFTDRVSIEEQNAIGANLRNVWKIPTQGVSDAHFATFPEKLVEPCILAGTSAEGACEKCGAPWARVVETSSGGTTGESWHDHSSDAATGNNKPTGEKVYKTYRAGITTGWKPTCDCEEPTVPCTVLDPFVGSGTTLRVATRLNRRGIGLDLTYQDIAKKRTSRVQRELPLG